MNSLTHITEAEIARFYFLEGVISGNDKKVDYLNGVQQNYVVSRMYNFNTWDAYNQSMTKLYIKENLPKMEIKYDTIKQEQKQKQEQEQELVKKKQELVKKKQEQEQELVVKRKKIIHELFREPNENIRNRVLQRFSISEGDYKKEVRIQYFKKEIKEANKICADIAKRYKLNNL
jgi:hypothetical protein